MTRKIRYNLHEIIKIPSAGVLQVLCVRTYLMPLFELNYAFKKSVASRRRVPQNVCYVQQNIHRDIYIHTYFSQLNFPCPFTTMYMLIKIHLTY